LQVGFLKMSKKIAFLGAGGTIAGTAASADDNVGYTAAQVRIQDLMGAIPTLQTTLAGDEFVAEQVCQVDSKDMEIAQWLDLASRLKHHLAQDEVRAVVVTHGTDTMEETAFFLSCVVPATLLAAKPVVMTCAMRPSSSLTPDGPQNVLDSVAVARHAGACGVMVVCAGVVHLAAHVQKIRTYRLDAFDSGDSGPLAYVEEGRVRLLAGWPVNGDTRAKSDPLPQSHIWPRVEIVMNHAGASGAGVRAMCAHVADGDVPVRGIVVAGTGNGTMHHDLEAALRAAQNKGLSVVRSTRCAYGSVVLGSGQGGPFRHMEGLSPVKARIALMLELLP
jgi:L-asparaginase